jgi:hypothetical protein
MSLVWNERTKLLAGSLDRASTVCITVGIATPVSAFMYGSGLGPGTLAAACYVWLTAAFLLHLAGRRILGSLEE